MSSSHLGLAIDVPNYKKGLLTLPELTSPVFAYDAKWALANSKVWQDEAKTTLATSDGDVIGAVEQVTGFGAVDARQATTAAKPLLKLEANGINGQPTMLFDGNDWLNLTDITGSNGAYTFYVVYEPQSAAGTLKFLLDVQTGRFVLAHLATVDGQTGYFNASWKNVMNATADIQILTLAGDGTTGTFYRNGQSVGSDAFANIALGGTITLGKDYASGTNFFGGKMSAIYCQNAVVPAERLLMEAYLAQEYGITLS